jgi:GntR family transcriptional regulator
MVDKNSSVSLHIQIRNELLGEILSGKLEPGDRLPSEREMQERFGVSRTTARLALADLVRAGFIYKKPGKGSFVAFSVIEQEEYRLAGFTERSEKDGARVISKVLRKRTFVPPNQVTSRLRLDPHEQVIYIKRLRIVDEIPLALDDAYLPLKICPEILDRDLEHESLYENLRGLALTPVRAEQMMRSSMPTEEEKALLELGEAVPIMRIERIAFLSDGKPIEYAQSTYRGDKYHFSMILGRGGDTRYFRGP